MLYNYPLRFEHIEEALSKYEGLKKMIQRIVGVIDESVDYINESISQNSHMYSFVEYQREASAIVRARQELKELQESRLPKEQQAFKEAMQRGQSQIRRSPRITVTIIIENDDMEVEEIS
ncbi:23554_t:CDS:2 [Cetraspora pellucida]|uniref:23554_t:CDS:1 n=1 Tax=Cetraspora pellucida TaxID=1433469 RepID=A0A9N8ZAI6_9GLOM|nr:23554_t:CDS:2 [Cetraspora pellucida]